MDVAALLRLNIRRRGGARVVYADCPICGDRRGKLGLYPEINTWRCYHCGEHGGMLPLYGKVHGISNSEAYREICDALATGGFAPDYEVKEPPAKSVSVEKVSDAEISRTLTELMALLTLRPEHREHLRTVRGLTDREIADFGFKSTPASRSCRSLTVQLMKQSCHVRGVPGFYVNDYGKWTVKFYDRTAGKEFAEANRGYAVVRGIDPVAKGDLGDILAFAKESVDSKKIIQVALAQVDGKKVMPNTWYGVDLKRREAA